MCFKEILKTSISWSFSSTVDFRLGGKHCANDESRPAKSIDMFGMRTNVRRSERRKVVSIIPDGFL